MLVPRAFGISLKKKYSPSWDDIAEEDPDEIDLKMLEAIKTDPDCHEFTEESGIQWDL